MADSVPSIFALEADILERLRALQGAVPGLHVGSAVTLVGVTNVPQYMPGVFIRPLAAPDAQQVGMGYDEIQRWEVVAGVQAIGDKHNLSTTYEALGRLAHRVIAQLHDWQASDGNSLTYLGRDEPIELPGHVEVSLNFEIAAHIDPTDGTSLDDFLRFYPTYPVESDTNEDRIGLPPAEAAP